ncbi:MAG: hypothetical protein HFE86_04415 [Clostridiales bacterium]|nr:hypothetical protein [Clostridiales bacterium]
MPARVGGLTSKRRGIAFRLADDTALTLAVSRRVFAKCPHRATGQLTARGRCFQRFAQDGIGGVKVGRPARTGGSPI